MIKDFIDFIKDKIRGEVRINKLKKRGLVVGENCNIYKECIIDYRFCWLISIGDNVIIAPRVTILAHDASTAKFINSTKIGKVNIGNNVYIGTGSIILPNVTIGDDVIIGAGTVVAKSIPSNSVVVGNPARIINHTDLYINNQRNLMKVRPVYSQDKYFTNPITQVEKDRILECLNDGIGYSKF